MMNELDVNQVYSFSYPGIGGFYGGNFYSRQILNEHCLFVQSYSIDLFMVLQCNMMQTAWTVHSFVKTGIQFLKKGNFC